MSRLIISVSHKPGKGGETFHNANFELLGLDYKYVAIYAKNMVDVIDGIRRLGIHGCSVSMPFKQDAYRLVDEVDSIADEIESINTILNVDGKLVGFNTDLDGALATFETLDLKSHWKVCILGDGGVARSIQKALELNNVRKIEQYSRKLGNWDERGEAYGELLINATSIGTYPYEPCMPENSLESFSTIFDVQPHTTWLTASAKGLTIQNANGVQMKQVQARKQFEIYTGIKL